MLPEISIPSFPESIIVRSSIIPLEKSRSMESDLERIIWLFFNEKDDLTILRLSSAFILEKMQFDMDTGRWYESRPLESEADRAIEYVYRNI